MRKGVAATALVLTGWMTTAIGVAHADEVEVDGSYSTLAACQTDGPHVEIERNDAAYTHWDCREGNDGLYHLWLSN